MKKLILGLLLASIGWSQNTGQNVVELTTIPTTTYAAGTYPLNTVPLQNIGQSSHIVKFQFGTVTGTAPLLYGAIQGANGNCTNWFNIGPFVNNVSTGNLGTNSVVTAVGYGAYPCIRVSFTLTVYTSAVLTESYIGTSIAIYGNMDQYSPNTSVIPVTGQLVANSFIPIGQGSPTTSAVLYGYSFFGPATITEIDIQCMTTSLGTGLVKTLAEIDNATNLQLMAPVALRAYGLCPIGTYLGINITGTGTGSYNLQYRIE